MIIVLGELLIAIGVVVVGQPTSTAFYVAGRLAGMMSAVMKPPALTTHIRPSLAIPRIALIQTSVPGFSVGAT